MQKIGHGMAMSATVMDLMLSEDISSQKRVLLNDDVLLDLGAR